MAGATCPQCGYINQTGFDVKTTKKGKAGGWDHHHTAECSDCQRKFTIVAK